MQKIILAAFCISVLVLGSFGFNNIALAKSDSSSDHVPNVKAGKGLVKIVQAGNLRAEIFPLYTTVDDPVNHETNNGGEFDGVAKLLIAATDGYTYGCSGSLMTGGLYVLTAAHCVTDSNGRLDVISGTATFEGDFGTYVVDFDTPGIVVHPSWKGDIVKGNDVALIKLQSTVNDEIIRYDLDRDSSNDLATQNIKVGYGLTGTGDTGASSGFGTKRTGVNLYDDHADTMWKALHYKPGRQFTPGSQLQYDFDNGKSTNDAFGFFFQEPQLGLGTNEVSSAPGDSGGPTFSRDTSSNLIVTGITSYGIRLSSVTGQTSDIDSTLDSSFGEFSGDTSVAYYSSFIDSVLSGTYGDGGSSGGGSGSNCSPGQHKHGLC